MATQTMNYDVQVQHLGGPKNIMACRLIHACFSSIFSEVGIINVSMSLMRLVRFAIPPATVDSNEGTLLV